MMSDEWWVSKFFMGQSPLILQKNEFRAVAKNDYTKKAFYSNQCSQ